MAAARNTESYESIMRSIAAGQFKPVYLLMGEESYYIDKIVQAIEEHALTEEDKAFNMEVFYGMDANIGEVVNCAKRYPMGAERSVVELREAQHVREMDSLLFYLQNPQPTTILVITYKQGTADRRKKWVSLIASQGVVFESAKLREDQLPALIATYARDHGRAIDIKSAMLIADSIGSDLSRLFGALDKLFLSVPEGSAIDAGLIEKHIGISKDFNYFELQNALVEKNVFKANQIIKYFDNNQKANPIQMILPMMFRFFSGLMAAYYVPGTKSPENIAAYLGMSRWQVERSVFPAMRKYTAGKVLQILAEIRKTDARSKGGYGSKTESGDLIKELLFFILH